MLLVVVMAVGFVMMLIIRVFTFMLLFVLFYFNDFQNTFVA